MSLNNKRTLSLIFSFLNEEEVLQELINRVEKSMSEVNYDYELIFVNDASTDKSLSILEENRKRNQRIKIINMSRRFGITPCVIAGYKHAVGDAVVHMDSDLQDPPEILPKLIKKWEEGYDVVHTVRTKRKGENFFKMFVTKIAYKIIAAVSSIKILENSGDFKLISRKALESILKLDEDEPLLRGLPAWVGYKQTKVYYERDARFAGKSHVPFLSSSKPRKEFIRGITSFSSVPLYISLYLGFLVSFGSIIYMLYIIVQKQFFGMQNTEWSSLMIAILMLGGLILFAIGIQGIYLGMVHQSLKNRPKYIIESKKGFTNNTTNEN